MFTWIISTAQQARPKVIHHSEPVRAQVNRSSVEVTRKPFSSSSWRISRKLRLVRRCPGRARRARASSSSVGRGFGRGSSITPIRALPSSRHRRGRAPVRRGRSSSRSSRPSRCPISDYRPGEQERRFEVEHDEQDGDQVEADVELRAAVLERGEAALIFGSAFPASGLCVPVRRLTSIGSTTNAADSASATPRNSRIGRYPAATLAKGELPSGRKIGGALGRRP